jgi:GT2 family glycosyltransferase
MPVPAITVIIPCYKQAHMLADAVGSVLEQAGEPEIIVVDDGSPDNVAGVAATFGERVRYIRQTNAGLSGARNTGIREARGQFVVFLDADDWLAPGAIAAHLAAVKPEVAATCGGWRDVDPTGRPLGPAEPAPEFLPDAFTAFIPKNLAPCHCYMIRHAAFDHVGLFDTTLKSHEDWDMWLRIAAAGHRFVPVHATVALYRRMPASMSRNYQRMLQTRAHVLETSARLQAGGAHHRAALEMAYDNLFVEWCRAAVARGISPATSAALYRRVSRAYPPMPRRMACMLLRRGVGAIAGGRSALWAQHLARLVGVSRQAVDPPG